MIDPVGIERLAIDREPESPPKLRRAVEASLSEFEHAGSGDLLIADQLLQQGWEFGGEVHGQRIACHHEAGDGAGRRGIALIERDTAQRVGSGLASLHQDVEALAWRHQHGVWMVCWLIGLDWNAQAHPREGNAVAGD